MQRLALIHGRVVLPHRVLEDGAVLIEEGRIAAIIPSDQVDESWETVDVENRLITPGLIDIHIHGANGHTFNEPSVAAYSTITQENARRGVTSLLATTATDSIENLIECLAFTQEWMSTDHPHAQILGSHVEGPYFSLAQCGAQDPAHIRTPDDGSVDALLTFAETIRLLTLAPELAGATALIQRLQQLGIKAAAGHSDAKEEELLAAIDAGLSHMIHIWSGQSNTVREGPWRKPGLLEVTLTYDCLGPDRLCIISDATSGAGLSDGARYQMGGMSYEVHDGVGMLLDRTAFAGSTTLLNAMLPVLIDVVGVPLVEAVRMATLTPARIIGVDRTKGSLEVGKDADIGIFEDDFRAWGVLIGGRMEGTE